jgi:hypothetical protein
MLWIPRIIFSLYTILIINTAHAGVINPSRESDIYRQHFKTCSQTLIYKNGAFMGAWAVFKFRTIRDSFSNSFSVIGLDPMAIGEIITNYGYSPQVAQALRSPDFHLALKDCYGSNGNLKANYISAMISSDLEGKKAAVGLTVLGGWAVAKIITKISAGLPMLRYGIIAGSTGLSVHSAYTAIKEVLRDPNAEERADAKQLLSAPLEDSSKLIDETELLLRREIASLGRKYASADGDERIKLKRRIEKLRYHLDGLETAEKIALK